MRVLFLADRFSVRGGADLHLCQVIEWALEQGWKVELAAGRIDSEVRIPDGLEITRVRGLASSTETNSRLKRLTPLLRSVDVIHAQNVMNPEALRRIVGTGKAVVTVQDHRVFCPGGGKTVPDGRRCIQPMDSADCSVCLEDEAYREQMEALTAKRLEALQGAALVVLSRYMADELAAVGLVAVEVIPPWVEPGPPKIEPGNSFVLAGRLVRHKGVVDGWKAWIDAGRPLPLKVAGEGAEAQLLEGVTRMGWVDHHRCVTEIGSARALLFPSFWQEPFGMLGIESLANGTPVIAMVSGGMEDWADIGCVVVEPGNVSAFSAAITGMAADPETARALGERGRVMVGERFRRKTLALRLQAVYEGL